MSVECSELAISAPFRSDNASNISAAGDKNLRSTLVFHQLGVRTLVLEVVVGVVVVVVIVVVVVVVVVVIVMVVVVVVARTMFERTGVQLLWWLMLLWLFGADDRLLFLVAATYGAERRHSSSWSWKANCGLQGFPPGQGSTALLSSGERISERTVEQTVDIPVGGLQEFRPGLSSSSSYFPTGVPEALDEPGQGVFSHFSTK